jgi:hypothetical protein
MKFRSYLQKISTSSTPASLLEADLLGVSSVGASTTDSGGSSHGDLRHGSPQGSQAATDQPPESSGTPLGSGRPPDAMDGQFKKAGALATELLKILTTMPHPWNRRFGPFIRALRGLLDKLSQVS